MDARASIVSNNLNVLMKTLTIITIAIMVPTLVVSIFSMNVTIPLSHEARCPSGSSRRLPASPSLWWRLLAHVPLVTEMDN